MADSIVHNHTPKSETEERGLFDHVRNKDENNEAQSDGLLAKPHITDISSVLTADEEEKKKDRTTKEQVEEKIEENVKMNIKIIQARDAALNHKQKTMEQIIEGGKKKVGDIKLKIGEKIGGNNEKKEAKECHKE